MTPSDDKAMFGGRCAVVWLVDGKTHVGFVGWNIQAERSWAQWAKGEEGHARPMCIVKIKPVTTEGNP